MPDPVTALDVLVGEPGPGGGDQHLAASTREATRLVHPMRLTDQIWGESETEMGLAGSRFSVPIEVPSLAEAAHAVLPLPSVTAAAHHLAAPGLDRLFCIVVCGVSFASRFRMMEEEAHRSVR